MNQVLVFLLGVILGVVVVSFWFFIKYKEVEGELLKTQNELKKEKEILGGFEEYNKKIGQIKEDRKRKILEALKGKNSIKTKKVAGILDVSRATAFRYLEELEKEGKIEQIGSFGKEVEYKAKF